MKKPIAPPALCPRTEIKPTTFLTRPTRTRNIGPNGETTIQNQESSWSDREELQNYFQSKIKLERIDGWKVGLELLLDKYFGKKTDRDDSEGPEE